MQANSRYDYKLLDDARRQRVITHSWEIIGWLANTSALCGSWGLKLRIKAEDQKCLKRIW